MMMLGPWSISLSAVWAEPVFRGVLYDVGGPRTNQIPLLWFPFFLKPFMFFLFTGSFPLPLIKYSEVFPILQQNLSRQKG